MDPSSLLGFDFRSIFVVEDTSFIFLICPSCFFYTLWVSFDALFTLTLINICEVLILSYFKTNLILSLDLSLLLLFLSPRSLDFFLFM